MSENPTLYDLFGPNLKHWERLVAEGELPTDEELVELVKANTGEPLPNWLLELVEKGILGELKRRPGRRKLNAASEMWFWVAKYRYRRILRWLTHRDRNIALRGWCLIRGKELLQVPPHELAARMVTARMLKHMSWRSFLNKVSS